MAETKHTPGPWRTMECTGRKASAVYMPETGPAAQAHKVELGALVYTSDADARLMAAAPDLLEALADLIRGEPADLTNLPCHSSICPADKCLRCRRVVRARAAIAKAGGRHV